MAAVQSGGFRPQLRTAPLKPVRQFQTLPQQSRFRPQLRTAPLKPEQQISPQALYDGFPSSTEDGSIEAKSLPCLALPGLVFPSSTEDGSIEAAVATETALTRSTVSVLN